MCLVCDRIKLILFELDKESKIKYLEEFQQFLKKEIGSGKFRITKDAVFFICKKVRKQYERGMSDL